jgi:glycogen(starch) synthase
MDSELTQARMREICWEIGTKFPFPFQGDHIAFSMIKPRHGHLQWHVQQASVDQLREAQGGAFHGATMVIRVYDVTNILFDGYNAHKFFDLEISGLSGNHYLMLDEIERNMLAEIGFRLQDGSFHYLCRSNSVYFDRDRSSGNYEVGGLFVGQGFSRVFAVENIFDAPFYEGLNDELEGLHRQGPLSLAIVFLGLGDEVGFRGALGSFIQRVAGNLTKFGGDVRWLTVDDKEASGVVSEPLIDAINTLSETVFTRLSANHQEKPFDLVHCHDWYSAEVGLMAAERLNLPMVLTLHSTEHERAHGSGMDHVSNGICQREKQAIEGAQCIIVPHSSTRQQVITLYGAAPEDVVIIPDVFVEQPTGPISPADVKRSFGLNPHWPVVLFAGEISHAAGADLLLEALPTVCAENSQVQFVFAGEGPLKGELESRAWHAGIGNRCWFMGDVSHEVFESLLIVSDFLVIPARTWQDEGLAQMAISFGRPVLTTHQSHIHCVVHGQNGLVTYDNPGSIIWGVKELLANPLQGSMLRLAAKKDAMETQSVESIAAQHYINYAKVLSSHLSGSPYK